MDDMIERAARALAARRNARRVKEGMEDIGVLPWDFDDARAAIKAMREPTEAMASAGESAASFGIGKPFDDEALPRVWHAMIDAALATKDTSDAG